MAEDIQKNHSDQVIQVLYVEECKSIVHPSETATPRSRGPGRASQAPDFPNFPPTECGSTSSHHWRLPLTLPTRSSHPARCAHIFGWRNCLSMLEKAVSVRQHRLALPCPQLQDIIICHPWPVHEMDSPAGNFGDNLSLYVS